ncbi:DUF2501 domain-containing protein [Salinicola avicenniae]|uniref:DUF2501 domain-containing protein n=1 Tax=Salinicola avicenniae TaxID=2916836 RepID=UPI0020745D2E|nr:MULTISPECIES: DUF2501 domain-containing protein [unclassified Salinicola]
MPRHLVVTTLSTILLTATLSAAPLANAFSLDSATQSAGNLLSGQSSSGASASSGASLLNALGSGSLNLGSVQNAAGVLGYCQEQGYMESTSERVKNRLMEQFGGQAQAEQSTSYREGLSGLLQGGNGQSFSLTGLKDQLGERACGMIADQAMSSFLGG